MQPGMLAGNHCPLPYQQQPLLPLRMNTNVLLPCLLPAASALQTLNSFAGRLDPARALTDRQRVSQLVTSKVLGWARMGCTAGDVGRMLQEDAAEVRGCRAAALWWGRSSGCRAAARAGRGTGAAGRVYIN